MCVDPTEATPMKLPIAHESHDFAVRDDRCLIHLLVIRQKPLPPTLVTNQEFAVHELVAADFVATQERIQFGGIRRAIREESNPDGRVGQDARAAGCLADDERPRRRGTSRASGSEPRSARRRS
jgi:hypothetical protein